MLFFRPFVVVPIPSSNLVLLVIDKDCPKTDPHYKVTLSPYKEEYSNDSLACYRSTETLQRRRPTSCINRHINVSATLFHCFYSFSHIIFHNYRKVLLNTVAEDMRPQQLA